MQLVTNILSKHVCKIFTFELNILGIRNISCVLHEIQI